MIVNLTRILLRVSLICLISLKAFAEVPVVDDSDNFAMLEEQQDALASQPLASASPDDFQEEPALAYEDIDTQHVNTDNAAILEKLQNLQQELQELRGQLEVQAHDLKLLQQQQQAFYKDIDSRLHAPSLQNAKKEGKDEVSLAPGKPPQQPPRLTKQSARSTSHANPAEEQISYLAAYELVKNKQYEDALMAMQAFVNQYPQSGYTANAQYWLGELFLVKKDYPQAINHFEAVLEHFPSSSKSAASMLKIGYALAAEGKIDEAKQKLQQVIKNYPDTNTAQLAATKLESLNP